MSRDFTATLTVKVDASQHDAPIAEVTDRFDHEVEAAIAEFRRACAPSGRIREAFYDWRIWER